MKSRCRLLSMANGTADSQATPWHRHYWLTGCAWWGAAFKYHRPRGILTAGAEECNALVTVGQGALEEPNIRATLQPLYDGLTARSQNCWPGVKFDIGRSLDYLHFLWPAGFYNKTFIWPHWHWYEGFIRRLSGLGKLPPGDDPDHYTHHNVHCDVLVVGSGPAGLGAALAASEQWVAGRPY